MNRVTKGILWIGLALAAVIMISIPVYQKISAKNLDVKEQETSVVDETVQNMPVLETETADETTIGGAEPEKEKETVSDKAGGYKHMEVFPDSFTPSCDYEEAEELFYSAKPEDYEDEALRELAAEYAKKGYYLTDVKLIKDTIGEGYGFGDYGFVTGFRAVDSKGGSNSCCIEVLKATREEYDLFIDDYFEDGETYEEKTDGNVITIDYNCYKLTYDIDREILIYYADLTGEGVG